MPLKANKLLISFACLLGIVQVIHLLVFIYNYSVDLVYWDQWDLYSAFFSPHSIWKVFSWQHGPHRQGLGNIIIWFVNSAADWNQRMQCVAIGVVVLGSAFLWVLLKRLVLDLQWFDIIPFLLILSLKQYEAFVGTPNISHGALPLFLLLSYLIILSCQGIYYKYILICIFNFFLVFTGFGLFAAFSTISLLLVEEYLSIRRKDMRNGVVVLCSLGFAMLTVVFFFSHYTFQPAIDTFAFPDPHWYLYPVFMAIEFGAHLLPGAATSLPGIVFGSMVFACMIVVLIVTFRSMIMDTNEQEHYLDQVIFLLVSFSLLFSLNAAIGRISLGLPAASSSRYIYLIIPGYISLFLFVQKYNLIRQQWIWVPITLCVFCATFPLWQAATCKSLRTGKLTWIKYYHETKSVSMADGLSNFKVHPEPLQTNLDAKLEWLECRKLSFFQE